MATVTICSDFGAPQNKVSHCFHFYPSISHEVMGPDAMILVFRMLSFKPTFSLSSFHFHQEALQFFFTFCHKGGVLHIWGCWYFSPQSWSQVVLQVTLLGKRQLSCSIMFGKSVDLKRRRECHINPGGFKDPEKWKSESGDLERWSCQEDMSSHCWLQR